MQIVVDVNTDRGERRRPPTQPKLWGFRPDNPNSCVKKRIQTSHTPTSVKRLVSENFCPAWRIKESQEIRGNLFTFLEKNETTFHCKLLDNCEKSRGQKRENAERARCLPGEAWKNIWRVFKRHQPGVVRMMSIPDSLSPWPLTKHFGVCGGGSGSFFAGYRPCWGNWARGYQSIATFYHVWPRWLAQISLPFLSLTAEGVQEEEEARYKRRGEDHCGSREGLTKRRKTKEERNYPQDFAGVFHTFFSASVTPSLNFTHFITYWGFTLCIFSLQGLPDSKQSLHRPKCEPKE